MTNRPSGLPTSGYNFDNRLLGVRWAGERAGVMETANNRPYRGATLGRMPFLLVVIS